MRFWPTCLRNCYRAIRRSDSAAAAHPARFGLFVAAVLAQQFGHFLVAVILRQARRRLAAVGLGIDCGFVDPQQLRHFFVAITLRQAQRRSPSRSSLRRRAGRLTSTPRSSDEREEPLGVNRAAPDVITVDIHQAAAADVQARAVGHKRLKGEVEQVHVLDLSAGFHLLQTELKPV